MRIKNSLQGARQKGTDFKRLLEMVDMGPVSLTLTLTFTLILTLTLTLTLTLILTLTL